MIIDDHFQSLIPPLSAEEKAQLEENIKVEGCRDTLITWQGILLDGHNRFEICNRLNIPFRTMEIDLPDRDAAEDWIDKNQLGRRNLTPDQMSLLRGRRYNRAKKAPHRPEKGDQNDPLNPQKTADRLAKEHGVSPATIKRDGKIAAFMDEHPEEAKAVIQGEKKLADVKRETKKTEIIKKLESIEVKEAKAIEGVYDVIVIDPPWPMEKIERDCRPNQSKFDYPTMDIDHIKYQLEVPHAKDCHIWIWTTQKFLPVVFEMIHFRRMTYVCTFVWHKPGGFQPIGLPQYNAEFAVYCRFGHPSFIDTKAFPVCFTAPRGKHSEKPEAFYDVLRRVTAGRRLDMFSRRSIDGFDSWGNEA